MERLITLTEPYYPNGKGVFQRIWQFFQFRSGLVMEETPKRTGTPRRQMGVALACLTGGSTMLSSQHRPKRDRQATSAWVASNVF